MNDAPRAVLERLAAVLETGSACNGIEADWAEIYSTALRRVLAAQNDLAAPETPPDRDDLTEPEALASKLIDVWIAEKGRKIPWATAIKICAAVTKQPDDERDALLALATDDAAPQAKDLTDDVLDSLWLHRGNIHNGELMPQLRDYARAVLAAQSHRTISVSWDNDLPY